MQGFKVKNFAHKLEYHLDSKHNPVPTYSGLCSVGGPKGPS